MVQLMAVTLLSANLDGFRARKIDVEVDLTGGLHQFKIVGLPDKAVEEARERVAAAVRNSGAKPPQHHNRRVTINLAPADVKKHGTWFDLPIATAFLLASEQLEFTTKEPLLLVGELGLDGTVRSVSGVLAAAVLAKELNALFVFPKTNRSEAMLVPGLRLLPVSSIQDLIAALEEGRAPEESSGMPTTMPLDDANDFNFAFIRGQQHAKRAMEIAAAGNHNLLMIGPPGAGKTLLARALPTILPKLSPETMVEVTTIWSVAGLLHPERPLVTMPPFRAPHHTSSRAALVGGGSGKAMPGEVTLAHRGVLFLDELPEFPRHVLEALRQPIEDGVVTVSRSEGTATYPARFLFLAAQNPCPCGNETDPERECICSAGDILRYRKRVSGPMLDRIDLHVDVPRLNFDELRKASDAEPSANIRSRIEQARQRQKERFAGQAFRTNAEIPTQYVEKFCSLDMESEALLRSAHDKYALSPRAITRMLKVARTITDLDGEKTLTSRHISEAIQYRTRGEETS